jgi:Uma2 family endonuclease
MKSKAETRANASRNGHAAAPRSRPVDRELTIDELIIQDDEPVDNIFVEKQQRLLTESLETSWKGPGKGRPFAVFSNVGLFPEKKQTPLVPDVMLVVDVAWKLDTKRKETLSYFLWIVGKPPDVVIEVVSDRRGGEARYKMDRYAKMGVPYYVIYDPERWLKDEELRSFELERGTYRPLAKHWFPGARLGLRIWEGSYADLSDRWLRWSDSRGRLIPTGAESTEQAARTAVEAKHQAERERRERERLEARLRELGHEP